MEVDRWGVPARMFGPVPEEFYALVGRVVLVTSLLEDRLHVLYSFLARAPQQDKASKPGTELIKECRKQLHNLREEQRPIAEAFLDEAQAALRRRHEVVHSLWNFTSPQQPRGWRNMRPKQQSSADPPVKWKSLPTREFLQLLTTLVDLVGRCQQLEPWIMPPTDRPGRPEGS